MGAFWEDRYHATAVEDDDHLSQCMVYIDLNMVRAGVVAHPEEWPLRGYFEIQNPRQRYRIIDCKKLAGLFLFRDLGQLKEACRERVETTLRSACFSRDGKWTESIAVGSKRFVVATWESLGIKASGRKVIGKDDSYQLREETVPYTTDFEGQIGLLRPQNEYYWDDSLEIST